jgi:hypothetical protein
MRRAIEMLIASAQRPPLQNWALHGIAGKTVSRPHPYRRDEQTKGMRMQRSKPDSADRSVTPTTPRATSPDDFLGTTSEGLRPRSGNRTRSVCGCQKHRPGSLCLECYCFLERSAASVSSAESASPFVVFLSRESGPSRTSWRNILIPKILRRAQNWNESSVTGTEHISPTREMIA